MPQPMLRDKPLTQARLRQLVSYDPETGVFTRLTSRGKHYQRGDVAGQQTDHGYWRIQLDGNYYYGHRLAWLYTHGRWPDPETDHANMDRSDNRLANLREATISQNRMNRCAVTRPTVSGVKGVCWDNQKFAWRASVKVDRVQHHIGFFRTVADAARAVRIARERLHGEFTRHDR